MTIKYAVVTGATGGIGREFCLELARRGWGVVACGRDGRRLDALVAELEGAGAATGAATGAKTGAKTGATARASRHIPLVCDLSEKGAAEALFAQVDSLGVEPELLVNNAGFGLCARLDESDLDRQRALMQVDVVALTELCQLFGGAMAERGRGAILNVASVAGVMPGPGMSTYFAAKAYVLSLSEALHDELGPRGVRVCALCPGPVKTAFWDVAESDVGYLDPIMLRPRTVARRALLALRCGRTAYAPGLLSKLCYGFGRAVPFVASRKAAALFNHCA